ncbi:uncharacterized protein LOC113553787 [Rhopalosiphum maidis]|uniref:uncharacterized protein LOC113553787 n=1 Tax=Rhopalosiphum maidis TaxID=43146 RepID=UPI000F00C642|nr:uncharacterized protein LOC113553787 [Rhopalosiphum maidis]
MRHLPVIWMPLALVTLIASRGIIGLPTKSQLRQLISMILYEDQLFDDVLSENVKLDDVDQKLSPFIKEKVPDIKNVDPLVTLYALTSTHPYYSGDDLNLSVTIVGTSIMCLTYKRVALHLALLIGLIDNMDGRVHFKMRSSVFAHAIPFYMDMLSSVYKKFDDLLTVYETVFAMISSDSIDHETNLVTLKNELGKLNAVIASSCVVNKMKEYCSSLKLSKLEKCENIITEDQQISDSVDVNTYVESLKENENAIMNLFDEMDLIRHMDRYIWKTFLNIPDLPLDDPTQFNRTEKPTYRDEVEEIIERRKSSIKYDIKIENANNGENNQPPPADTSAASSDTVAQTEDKSEGSKDSVTPAENEPKESKDDPVTPE